MTAYNIGDSVRLTATFKNIAGAATDPTTITLYVQRPDETISTYTYAGGALTRSSAGVYTYDLSIAAAGVHRYRFVGTGDVEAATSDEEFTVDSSVFV